MNKRIFNELTKKQWGDDKFVCLGLYPNIDKIPEVVKKKGEVEDIIYFFNQKIIEATSDIVGFYKPNIAFYAGHGLSGLRALKRTCDFILGLESQVPFILDFKRADIGHTNLGYVREAFEYYRADAATLNPYLGKQAMQPFLDKKDKGLIFLCHTSNPGAEEFQHPFTLGFDPSKKPDRVSHEDWLDILFDSTMPLYQRVAMNIAKKME